MTSKVAICNLALGAIKSSGTVESIDPPDGSEEARYCAIYFDDCRDEVLRAADWNFARRYRDLSLTTDAAQGHWDYEYDYPSDCLRIREIVPVIKDGPRVPYEVALSADGTSRVILTNQDLAKIRYTARVTDTTLYDHTFVRAFAYRLAIDLAMPLTSDKGIMEIVSGQFSSMIAIADAQNANENQEVRDKQASWIEARNS